MSSTVSYPGSASGQTGVLENSTDGSGAGRTSSSTNNLAKVAGAAAAAGSNTEAAGAAALRHMDAAVVAAAAATPTRKSSKRKEAPETDEDLPPRKAVAPVVIDPERITQLAGAMIQNMDITMLRTVDIRDEVSIRVADDFLHTRATYEQPLMLPYTEYTNIRAIVNSVCDQLIAEKRAFQFA